MASEFTWVKKCVEVSQQFSLFHLAQRGCWRKEILESYIIRGIKYASEFLIMEYLNPLMLDSVAQPYSCIPCQTGFKIWLYRSILFSMDRWDLCHFIQYILPNLKFSSFSFFLMYSFQQSFVSSKYVLVHTKICSRVDITNNLIINFYFCLLYFSSECEIYRVCPQLSAVSL